MVTRRKGPTSTGSNEGPFAVAVEQIYAQFRVFAEALGVIKEDLSLVKVAVLQNTRDITELKGNVQVLRTDVHVLKGDVQVLKTDVHVLKGDVQVLKTDVHVLKGDVQVLKTDVHVLKGDVQVLKSDTIEVRRSVGRIEGSLALKVDRDEVLAIVEGAGPRP